MDFGKSQAKVQMVPDTGVTFNEVAGAEGAKLELMEVVDFLKKVSSLESESWAVHISSLFLVRTSSWHSQYATTSHHITSHLTLHFTLHLHITSHVSHRI